MKRAIIAAMFLVALAQPAAAQKVGTLPTASTPFSGSDFLYLVQGGASKKTTMAVLAQQVTLSLGVLSCGSLTNATTACSGDAAGLTSGLLPNARLSAVPNASLANSSVTISGHGLALGGSLNLAIADISGLANVALGPSSAPATGQDVSWGAGRNLKDSGPRRVFNIMAPEFAGGAKCDNTTNDSAAIAAAAVAAYAVGGGDVFIPATGKNCKITSGVSLGNSVRMVGSGTYGFPGTDNNCAQRAAVGGSWIQSTDTVNPAITLAGHGSGLEGVNICYDQPAPGGSFTPTAYGDAVRILSDQSVVRGINIMGATVGVSLTYTPPGAGGVGVAISDVLVTAFAKCFTANNVNDVITIRNLQCRNLYYASNAAVVAYLESHLIGMDLHYIDNPWIYGFECFQCLVGIKFTDDTVLGNTHSLYNGQLDGIQCNLVAACLQVASGSTTVDTQIGNLQAQGDTDTLLTATLFQLGSDNVNIRISNLSIRAAGGSLGALGNGTGGRLAVPYAQILGYSQITAAQAGFTIAAGATLTKGIWDYRKTGGSGALFNGAGASLTGVKSPGIRWSPFGMLDAIITGTGAASSFTTNFLDDPFAWGASAQGRIIGNPTVIARSPGDTCTFRVSNFTEVTTAAVTVPAAGNAMPFDSNYIDLTSSDNVLGSVQANCPATTQLKFGDLMVMTR